MKSYLFLLRLLGLLFLGLTSSVAEAKGCVGSIWAKVQHADGTITPLAGGVGHGFNTSVSLSLGDTVIVYLTASGYCYSEYGLIVKGAPIGDTATYLSPVVYGNSPVASTIRIGQPGSYLVSQFGFDNYALGHLFVDAIRTPVPVGLLFAKQSTPLGLVDAGDTCTGPCVTAYLQDGQSVRMQAISSGMVQAGGNAVVRHAAEGELLNFGSPSTIVPMSDFEGYQFSEEGMYLLSVEGPYFTSSTYAYVRVSYLPAPSVDMSLTIDRADGSTEDVAYIQPGYNSSILSVHLDPGDSLRIDHHENTGTCGSVRLEAYASPDWLPATPTHSLLIMNSPSTSAGVHMATQGSYRLQHATNCGILTAYTYLRINAPPLQLELVISVLHSDGAEGELFRSLIPLATPPHLETYLGTDDSIRVHFEVPSPCGLAPTIIIWRGSGPEDATMSDTMITQGMGVLDDISFRGVGTYLISLPGQACYPGQAAYLHVSDTPIPGIDLQVDEERADGTSFNVTYAEAAGPMAFASVALAADDSIRVSAIVQQAPCTAVVLKGYRAETDTATTMDPVFLNSSLNPSGLSFHETGSLLLTLEDTCGAVTASAHLTVSAALSTGIATRTDSGFNARYANDLLLVDAPTGGLFQVRNMAGQLVREAAMNKGTMHHSIPFNGEAGGIYIATLLGPSHRDLIRFAVY